MSDRRTADIVEAFDRTQRELWMRSYLTRIASFDGATVAPAQGAAARGEALAALAGQRHAIMTGPDAVELVEALQRAEAAGLLGEQTTEELRVFSRDQKEAAAIPADEAIAWARLTCEAEAVWHRAKAADDWESFAPYVDDIVETLKRHAGYLDAVRDPYDVWLDQYERGLDSASFDAFCEAVRSTVVPLVGEINERGEQPHAPWLSAAVPTSVQLRLSYDLMALLGLDPEGTALAQTEHPFSDGFAPGDVRIATHIHEHDVMSNVFSMIHESGHALYEQNVNPAFSYSCLGGGTSMGIHESQSRFFENTVGRSRAFMGPLLELLRKHVPDAYGSVSEEELYRAVNIATPSLIRTEADELTYPLHIMIRYEIERLLFAGEASARDIPGLWAQLTKRYLGLAVPDDVHGCLQDVHWSGGSFGYFPTYALGSAYDAQFTFAMRASGVDLGAACATGDLAPVRDWLRERIWSRGRSADAPELIREACGADFDASYYCGYLSEKFRALYGL
ncbi:Carboxypeptidase Taq [Coriobacterium glomerans PW2]|uniref:Metal-dependent carboxypeptidase n=1 Tax=Coriobacterium glomerans (strain ATCC 49209 / DSM 20642 / JCM 10262 / PW2) TaxID=700015 RepID=F2N8Z8_CORGP|nr:carboxypeptidase M32 [Coriobacterium glomerans]AEB07598.1 Carboxypeptidase Taq [Coriobacterium glomerans PW2]